MQGHVYRSSTGKLERWYNPKWLDEEYMPTAPLDLAAVRVSESVAYENERCSFFNLCSATSAGKLIDASRASACTSLTCAKLYILLLE